MRRRLSRVSRWHQRLHQALVLERLLAFSRSFISSNKCAHTGFLGSDLGCLLGVVKSTTHSGILDSDLGCLVGEIKFTTSRTCALSSPAEDSPLSLSPPPRKRRGSVNAPGEVQPVVDTTWLTG